VAHGSADSIASFHLGEVANAAAHTTTGGPNPHAGQTHDQFGDLSAHRPASRMTLCDPAERFGSGGRFRPFTTERVHGLARAAWLRHQSWCDGQVSMTGGSYQVHTQ
jgi:hypothetical protein